MIVYVYHQVLMMDLHCPDVFLVSPIISIPQRKADKIRKQLIACSIWGVCEDFETQNEVVYKFEPTFQPCLNYYCS